MNVMKMRMYRRRCHVCGKVCNTTTLAAICARCRNIKRDTKMICGDAFSREHNNDVAEPSNVEFRNAASGAPGLDGGVQ